ncbi:hypothetical protein G6011_04435 [Alternaria panax]|uniref:Uncharacterized protein n=1 Tax=Alternaria panax TaxID=48097 RepID=A0AAD4IGV3_9PLEO|nr:hypothetical protein G6011_04435 [Alternaria panax]
MADHVSCPLFASPLIAERDGLEKDVRDNNAAIERWAVTPRWNWQQLRAARILQRRLDREVILLTIDIDIALTRGADNMEWLMSLSQEELRNCLQLTWQAVLSRSASVPNVT